MSLRRPLLPRKKLIISLPSVPKRTSPPRRFQSTSSSSSTNDKPLTRIDKILSRVPKFLRPWTNGLRNAPASNVVAFLILHELTAAVPLVGLAGLFHYADWLPTVIYIYLSPFSFLFLFKKRESAGDTDTCREREIEERGRSV